MNLYHISRAFSEQAHADGSAESSGGKSLNLSNISRAFPTRRMLMGVYRHLAANLWTYFIFPALFLSRPMLMGVQSHLAANLWRKCLDEIPDLSSIMRGTWYGRVANTCYTLYSILSLGGLLQTCVQPELFFGRPCMIILWPHCPGNNWNLRIENRSYSIPPC